MDIGRVLRRTFGFDYRSLAFYRFLLGWIVISDVLYRMLDLSNFYTDVGMVPRSTFISEMSMPWSFSLHLANGSWGFGLTMFLIQLTFGVMLMLGYKTRLAIVASYLLNVSIHNRNWLINNGGDDILRALLFISIFLPMNKFFSVDSALTEKKEKLKHPEHLSAWTMVFYLQVFLIYFVSAILKSSPIWWKDFTAMAFAGRLDIFSTALGVWIRDFTLFNKLITAYTIYLEYWGPILLIAVGFLGRHWWIPRLAVALMFVGLHAGIIATMKIGVFPWLCMVMWLLFVPGEFWDKLFARLRAKGLGALDLYYDGDCRFCKKGVLLVREFLLFPEANVRTCQEVPEINRAFQKENSWVVVTPDGQKHFHYLGMLEVIRRSPLLTWFRRLFALGPVVSLGQVLYRWVASHRMLLSQYSQFVEIKEAKRPVPLFQWVAQAFGVFIFTTILLWNLTTIKSLNFRAPFFQSVARWFHIYQEWNMFAPFPKMDNIWVEIPAELSNGEKLELLTGDRDLFSIKDQAFVKTVKNEHWRKFYLNLSEKTDNARYYGGYLCREWNERHVRWVPSTTLRKFEIIVYSQLNRVDGTKGAISRKLSWKHWCFDDDYKRESGVAK